MSGDEQGELVDTALRDEIALVGDLVVAAGDSDDHLSQSRIDEILGVAADDDCPDQGDASLEAQATATRRYT